ncbi:MAG: hypothetical protein JWM28_3271, partial [Chitinophagaceae bacterium]|nr:hypothetical protein [Chitinophagaceae bacterium]
MKCRFLLNEKFRQGLVYRLTEWNQLNNQQKVLLSGLHDEAEVYGVFEPADSSSELTFKVAYREVAMLYLHLQHFNKLPHYFIVSGGDHINDTVAQLLLNDIIQIAWEGSYVGGTAALSAVYGENIFTEPQLPGFLSDLSFKAIYYAWMLQDTNLRSVAGKLYAFNTVPWDASMKLAFYDTQRVEEFLFSRTDTAGRKSMDQQWYTDADTEKSSWLSWARRIPGKSSLLHSGGNYKLYISPVINVLPEVFMRFIPVISVSKAFSFKVG